MKIQVCALLCAGVVLGESQISPDALRTWLTYLSSDDLEGRATFSEGLGLAAAYIADQLKDSGVKPAGDHGTYFQRVTVLGIKTTSHSSVTVEVNGEKRTFQDGEGITLPKNVGSKRTFTIDDVQFAGYGLNLNSEHDDYRGLDVKGKAVVWLGARGPKGVDPQKVRRQLNARAVFATQEMGAAATIAPPREGPVPPPQAPQPGAPDFTTTQRLDHVIAPAVTGTDDFLEFLFSGSDVKYADLKVKTQRQEALPPFMIKGVKLIFNLESDYKVVNTRYTRNVVGVVEGSADGFVAFGAHYDHTGYNQGTLADGQTDRINNGADDDGSGTATLIGLARSFAAGPKTRRSLLFTWHAGEENGLYGSRYFADYPTVPLEKIVAQLNIDMIGRNQDNLESEVDTVYPVGSDRISSELHNIMIDANAGLAKPLTLNFKLNDATDPERVYYRSDHYSYAGKGIPIIFFTTGLHPDYHRVTDSVEKITFEKMAHIAQFIQETGRRVANLDHAPARDNKGPRLGNGASGKIQ